MKAIRAARALAPIDAKGVLRDPLLRWMIAYPLLLALVLRWGVPALAGRLEGRFGFDLSEYYVLLMSVMVEVMPILAGFVVGFLLLDGRDDGTAAALLVTPVPPAGYLAYRLAAPMAISVLVIFAVFPIAGLVRVGAGPLLAIALGAAPLAPLYALVLACFAGNKVEGFALAKVVGASYLPPVVAYFVEPPWRWAFGIVPTYWPAAAFWSQQAGGLGYLAIVLIGLAYQAALLALLIARYDRVVRR